MAATIFDLAALPPTQRARALTTQELQPSFAAAKPDTLSAGPLSVSAKVNADRGQALVTVTLAGQQVQQGLLSLSTPSLAIRAAAGGAQARGSATLSVAAPPQLSSVTVAANAVDGSGKKWPLRGQLASWTGPADPVVGDYVFTLSSDLFTLTTVTGLAANIATLAFWSGKMQMGSVTATQMSPQKVFPDALVLGSVKVEKGAAVNLTIPTAQEQGQVFLRATFSDASMAPTPVSSDVALWSLPKQSAQ